MWGKGFSSSVDGDGATRSAAHAASASDMEVEEDDGAGVGSCLLGPRFAPQPTPAAPSTPATPSPTSWTQGPPAIPLPRGYMGTTETAEFTATGLTDHLRAAYSGALAGSPPPAHRQEVPLEFAVHRGPQRGGATPSAEDGPVAYTVLVRVWLSEDYPFSGSIQPSMWYDRLQSRSKCLENTLRAMLRAFEAKVPVWPKGQTIPQFTETWSIQKLHELSSNYVLRVEAASGRHPKGRFEYFHPAKCGPLPNFDKSRHPFELPPTKRASLWLLPSTSSTTAVDGRRQKA